MRSSNPLVYTLYLLDITGTTVQAIFTDAGVQSWSKRLNAPGRLQFTLPSGSLNASATKLQKYKRVRLDRRKQDGSGTDETVWFGYIEAHKRTSAAEFTIMCAGLLQLFKYRFTGKNKTFTEQGTADAFALLTATNANDGNTGIVSGVGGVTGTHNLKASGYRDILTMWADIAKAHSAEFEIDDMQKFNFVPSLGTDKTATVKLMYHTDGTPGNNVYGLSEGEDGALVRNKVIGTNAAGTLTSTKQDATSQAMYGTLVDVQVFNDAQDQATLDQMTQEVVNQFKNPVTDFGALPILAQKQFNIVTGALDIAGLQYSNLVPGDLITCEILTENQNIQAAKRVIEILVNVDANMQESVQYTLGPQGVFVSVQSLGSSAPATIHKRLLALEQGGGGTVTFTFSDREVPSGAVNGSNVTFTLAHTPTTGSEYVWLNGLLQTSGVDYTISGGTVTFTTAPLTGAVVVVSYRY